MRFKVLTPRDRNQVRSTHSTEILKIWCGDALWQHFRHGWGHFWLVKLGVSLIYVVWTFPFKMHEETQVLSSHRCILLSQGMQYLKLESELMFAGWDLHLSTTTLWKPSVQGTSWQAPSLPPFWWGGESPGGLDSRWEDSRMWLVDQP